jgi:uncharacterized membrane protein YeiB
MMRQLWVLVAIAVLSVGTFLGFTPSAVAAQDYGSQESQSYQQTSSQADYSQADYSQTQNSQEDQASQQTNQAMVKTINRAIASNLRLP